jgi:FAD-dependent oxidoreductase domain-containing protein 1
MQTDIAIIGSGVMGAATAFWLTREQPRLRVTLIERDAAFTQASSALSASAIRQQFSCPVNIRLSRFGIEFLRDAARWLDEPGLALGLCEPGYLYLANAAQADALREVHAIQRREGADVALLDPAQIAARYPWLDTGGIVLGSLGLDGEGWFDGPALHQALLRQARGQGVQLLPDCVVGWQCNARGVEAVRLQGGTTVRADRFVVAAGGWSGELAARAGIELPVIASRRTVFVLSCPEPLPRCPLVIDPSGFWLRPEGSLLLTGREPDAEAHALPLDPQWSEFDEAQWALVAARIPALARLRIERAWAGYYEMNTFDHNAVIGPHPVLANLHFITGFSGHGMQHAPGAARALAEWMLEGAPRTIDVRALGFERLLRGEPLLERNLIG